MAKMTIPSLERLLFPAFRTGMGSNARLGKEYMLLGKVCNDGLGEMGMYLAKTPGMKERFPVAWVSAGVFRLQWSLLPSSARSVSVILAWFGRTRERTLRIKWRVQF